MAASYDGSRSAEGVRVYIDGQPAKLTILLDDLNQSFQVKEPLRIGAGGAPDARFRGLIDDVMVWRGVLSPEEVAAVADPQALQTLAAMPTGETKQAAGGQTQMALPGIERSGKDSKYLECIAGRRGRS